jgi:putative flippase GtrA
MPPSVSDAPPDLITFADIKRHVRRALHFGLVSGAGLAVDLTLFLILVRAGLGPFVANIASSGTALTIVYCVSVRRIFRYEGRFIVPLFALYLTYHVCGTLIVSEVVSVLVYSGVPPPLAKVGILPATFAANYAFMGWLTRRRQRWPRTS